ncbi:hypothetical protein L7F22_000887 [Adiantum nelumboides]|nr:hypothetical protein [Adiantum nelumboides]
MMLNQVPSLLQNAIVGDEVDDHVNAHESSNKIKRRWRSKWSCNKGLFYLSPPPPPHYLGRSHFPLCNAGKAKAPSSSHPHFLLKSSVSSSADLWLIVNSTPESRKITKITSMSCNGCRVLRKGCSDTCILRSCLQWIESPEAQGHATVFVAKFFGRAGMLSFINAVSESQRPALFQSLLYEACGRTVNPVFGAVGMLWSGNWSECQAAVETVLKGGSLKPTASPPSTKPLHTCQGNPLSKRPHNIPEANMSSGAEAERFRSSDCRVECPELRCNADAAHMDHSVPVFAPDCEADIPRNPGFLGNSESLKKEQSPLPVGQLVAPVARRAKPKGGYGLVSMVMRGHQQPFSQEQSRQRHETVELGLSLNNLQTQGTSSANMMERHDVGKASPNTHYNVESHACHSAFMSSLCSEDEQVSLVQTAGRAVSPCSLSINSEGSVTSVDTADFSIAGVKAFATSTSMHEDCQLLHLL